MRCKELLLAAKVRLPAKIYGICSIGNFNGKYHLDN